MRQHVENPPPEVGLHPAGDLEISEQDGQTAFRRMFTTEAGNVLGMQLAARAYLLGGLCIPGSDNAYVATFEAPAAEWETYQPVAQTMIEGIRLL